jgi:hypothetical protein
MVITANSSIGRAGLVLRVLPHGTVMIWDVTGERAYPFYKAGTVAYRLMEEIRFTTDETDTVVVTVSRPSPPSADEHAAAGTRAIAAGESRSPL